MSDLETALRATADKTEAITMFKSGGRWQVSVKDRKTGAYNIHIHDDIVEAFFKAAEIEPTWRYYHHLESDSAWRSTIPFDGEPHAVELTEEEFADLLARKRIEDGDGMELI